MGQLEHPTFFLKAFNGDTVEDVPIEKITGEVYELEDQMALMVSAVRDGQPLVTTGEDGMRSVAMCLAAQHSVETGKSVDLG